ncbi:hypothetical protein FRC00_011924, partial [Tulasnella sp. 408]
MAFVPQIANLATLKGTTQSLLNGVQVPLSGHFRRTMPDILSTGTSKVLPELPPARPQRPYSIGPLGAAHQGLSIPYPHDAFLDSSIFETPNPGPHSPSQSLPSLIHQRRFDEAARVRLMMAEAGIPIQPSWEYEKMAFRMLVPSLNPFNKARVNSFHVWWSLVPEQGQATRSPTAAFTRRQYLHRIITWLCRLDGPDCPTKALIQFGIAAASKGYAPDIADRLIPHITLWTHPALSAKFLLDFVKAHERYAGTSSQPQQWLMQAIETQMGSGRDPTALAFIVSTCQEGGLRLPPGFLRKYPVLVPGQTNHEDANPNQQANNSARSSTSSQGTSGRDRSSGRVLGRSPSSGRWAVRKAFAFPEQARRNRREGSLPQSFGVRRIPSESQLDHRTLLQVVHHLRSRNDPAAAFLHFKSRFETLNVVPPTLARMLNALVDGRAILNVRAGPRSEDHGSRAAETSPSTLRARRWPSAYGVSLLWQIALSARKELSIDFDELYQLFLQHVSQNMVYLDWQRLYSQSAVEDLRRIHSKIPSRPGRANIYAPWCPPRYAPSVHDFNAFLWGCTGRKDLSGIGSTVPSVVLEKAEHIIKDMEMVGVRPDR